MPGVDAAERFAAELQRQAEALGVELSSQAADRMQRHYELLLHWNRRINLTRVTVPEEAAVRHFGESLAFLSSAAEPWRTAVDVGSGAGFPGLVLAAALPEQEITLLEPVAKKAVFLREVSRDWGNVRVRDVRVEAFEGHFDWAWMRAVNVEEALGELGRIARNVALWVGPDGVRAALSRPGWSWGEAQPLPGGSGRGLLNGRRRST